MGRDDWYRRTTWTEADRRDFFARLNRCRGSGNKVQYLRIQALSLQEIGTPELLAAALSLLEMIFRDYPEGFDSAAAYEQAGRCFELLGRIDEAIDYFRRALARQRAFPTVITNACFYFGKMAVEKHRHECYDEVLRALDEFLVPYFPWHSYMAHGIRALIAEDRKTSKQAREFAQSAIQAASESKSGFSRHPTAGLVRVADTNSSFHARLKKLVGD